MSRSRGAKIIHLNPKRDSTRDIRGAVDGGYDTPPPVTVPYGWKLEPGRGGWALVHDREQWGVISWLIERRRAGESYQRLAERLERDQVPAPTGGRSKRRWHTERVRTLAMQYAPDLIPRSRADRLSELHALSLEELTDEQRDELDELEAAERAAAADESW